MKIQDVSDITSNMYDLHSSNNNNILYNPIDIHPSKVTGSWFNHSG